MTLRKNRPGRKIARKIRALDHMKVNAIAHEMNYTGNHRAIISAIENTETNITLESAKPLRTKKDRSKRGNGHTDARTKQPPSRRINYSHGG